MIARDEVYDATSLVCPYMKAEKVVRIAAHLILASILGAMGVTLIAVVSDSAKDSDLAFVGLSLIFAGLAYFAWTIRDYLPRVLRTLITDMAEFWWTVLRKPSQVGAAASALVFSGSLIVFVLVGIGSFLTAPIGFKAATSHGTIAALADAAWLPALGCLAAAGILYLIASTAVRSVKGQSNAESDRVAKST